MIRQTQQQANDTRPLFHYTRKHYIASIMYSGLRLEGTNVLAAANKGNKQIDELAKGLLHQYNIIGRYVWLTKGDSAEVINANAHHSNDLPMLKTLEPPRVYRRLQILEDWSDEQIKSIFPRGQGTRSAHGVGA